MDIAIIFPGQGSQYVGMGKKLYKNFAVAKTVFEEANDTLGFDLKKLCFDGDVDQLFLVENAQPAIVTVSFAAFKVYLQEIGITPRYMAGHSLGEFSALACAGVFRFSDAVKIVKTRGRLMQEAIANGPGTMVAIMGIDRSIAEEVCAHVSAREDLVTVCNYNSPEQIVLSGHQGAVERAVKQLEERGARSMQVNVNAPCHGPLMEPAIKKLAEKLSSYEYFPFTCPVISNVTALPYDADEEFVIKNLAKQIAKPVRWQESIEYIAQKGVKMFIEMSPQTVLRNLLLINDLGLDVFSFDDEKDKEFIKKNLEGLNISGTINKAAKYKFMSRCLAIAVCTENKNWNDEEYAKGVIEPYRHVHNMLKWLEKEKREPTNMEIKNALDMLKSVFITKRTSLKEQEERIQQLSFETGISDHINDVFVQYEK